MQRQELVPAEQEGVCPGRPGVDVDEPRLTQLPARVVFVIVAVVVEAVYLGNVDIKDKVAVREGEAQPRVEKVLCARDDGRAQALQEVVVIQVALGDGNQAALLDEAAELEGLVRGEERAEDEDGLEAQAGGRGCVGGDRPVKGVVEVVGDEV